MTNVNRNYPLKKKTSSNKNANLFSIFNVRNHRRMLGAYIDCENRFDSNISSKIKPMVTVFYTDDKNYIFALHVADFTEYEIPIVFGNYVRYRGKNVPQFFFYYARKHLIVISNYFPSGITSMDTLLKLCKTGCSLFNKTDIQINIWISSCIHPNDWYCCSAEQQRIRYLMPLLYSIDTLYVVDYESDDYWATEEITKSKLGRIEIVQFLNHKKHDQCFCADCQGDPSILCHRPLVIPLDEREIYFDDVFEFYSSELYHNIDIFGGEGNKLIDSRKLSSDDFAKALQKATNIRSIESLHLISELSQFYNKGMPIKQIAYYLGISIARLHRDWKYAVAMLMRIYPLYFEFYQLEILHCYVLSRLNKSLEEILEIPMNNISYYLGIITISEESFELPPISNDANAKLTNNSNLPDLSKEEVPSKKDIKQQLENFIDNENKFIGETVYKKTSTAAKIGRICGENFTKWFDVLSFLQKEALVFSNSSLLTVKRHFKKALYKRFPLRSSSRKIICKRYK